MLPLTLLFLPLIILNAYIFASYCGEDAIPFSLQTLMSGQPILGCARPSCFGWGTKTDKGARFYRIHKKSDGFMRNGDRKNYDKVKIVARESQLAVCEKNYGSTSCDENTQWVGGLSPSSNITATPLLLQCCTFDKLKNSWDRGIADVNPGQIVVGGEVMQDERQYAFDYIANIKKHINENGSVTYSVTIRRFWCLPYLTKSDLYVEENALRFFMDRIANYGSYMEKETNFQRSSPQFDEKSIPSNSFAKHIASQNLPSDSINRNLQPMQFIDATYDVNTVAHLSEDSRASLPPHSNLPISPIKDFSSIVSLPSLNQQQSIVPFNLESNQQSDISVAQPEQFSFAGQQTQQLPQQQSFISQQQSAISQPFLLPSQEYSQISQYQLQSLQPQLRQQRMQSQSALPQSSQFPIFPSFDQLAFPLP